MSDKIDVGGAIREAYSIYRNQAGILLPIAFWVFLIVAIVNASVGDSLALSALPFFVGIVAATLYEGAVVGLVRALREGRSDLSMGETVRATLPVLLPLIGAGLLAALGIFLGFLVLIVPGLIALTFWAVIAPAIVVERTGVFGAFSRSNQLVSGNGWRVFGVVLVTGLISIAALLLSLAIAEGISEGPLVQIVLTALSSTVTAPIEGLVAGVLYYRLLAIERAAPPAPADAPLAT